MQEFLDFLFVLGAVMAVAGSIGFLYALGLRLWAKSGALDGAENGSPGRQRTGLKVGTAACFLSCFVIVVYALYQIMFVLE